jgi:hypothetical protein
MTIKTPSNHSILVTLSISAWDANRQDRRASRDVAEANNVTDQRLCRLRKSLLPKTKALDVLSAQVRAARSFHYENTHAWMHDGPRILTRSNFDPYMTQMRMYKATFETAVLNVMAEYEDMKERARDVLGQLYDAGDYPARESLFSRYSFDTTVQPLPVSANLLDLGLESAEGEELRLSLEKDMADTFARANRRLWDDLFARLEKLTSKLGDEKAYVMEETIEAVRKLAELLPRMNITNDPNLEVLATHLTASLDGLSAEKVKHNSALRDKAAEDTHRVLSIMQTLRARKTPVAPAL